MHTHIVTRKFTGPGSVELSAGMRVDASNWKNLDPLVNTNYLRPLDANEMGLALETASAPRRRGPNKPKANPRTDAGGNSTQPKEAN